MKDLLTISLAVIVADCFMLGVRWLLHQVAERNVARDSRPLDAITGGPYEYRGYRVGDRE